MVCATDIALLSTCRSLWWINCVHDWFDDKLPPLEFQLLDVTVACGKISYWIRHSLECDGDWISGAWCIVVIIIIIIIMSSIVSAGCILWLGLLDKNLFAAVLDYPYSAFVSSVFWSPLPLLPLVTYWASMAFILTGNMFHSLLDWRFLECVGEDPNLGCDILLLGISHCF
jgi:hypothetical protein